MTRDKSRELRQKNNCPTCERRGAYEIGCQVFKEEPEKCWAWTDDKDWLSKYNKASKDYEKNRLIK